MRGLIRLIDRHLRRKMDVYEPSEDPKCIFRARIARLEKPVRVAGGEVPTGSKVLELHFWNEHLPTLPPGGATMAWGIRSQKMLAKSCRLVAEHLLEDPRTEGVLAVGGATVLVFGPAGERNIFTRLGFELRPDRGALGSFGEFWENLYSWLLMWSFNAATLRSHRLLGLRRSEFWMSAEDYLGRYAKR